MKNTSLLIFFMLVGCAAAPLGETDLPIPEGEGVEDEAKAPEVPRRGTVKAPEKKEAPPVAKILPPCESVPGDKMTAILQKLECVDETADKKPAKPGP